MVFLPVSQGKAIVQVESRDDNNDTFGRGRRSPIPFGEVVRRLAAGDTTLYLTSQPVRPVAGRREPVMV